MQNAIRDGAYWSWVPYGSETCAFCITLASQGYVKASKKVLQGNHATHIHENCKCEFVITFGNATIDGFDPDKYYDMYASHGGDIKLLRNDLDAQNRDKINAQKREAYARRNNEHEKSSNKNDHSVNYDVVGTAEYHEKFKNLTDDEKVNEVLYQKALDMLKHRNGTDYEDMYLISSETGEVVGTQTKTEYIPNIKEEDKHLQVFYNDDLKKAIKNNPENTLIAMHNHPNSLPPSGDDFSSQFKRKYQCGIIPCHNGDLYYYSVGKKKFSAENYDLTVAKYINRGYSKLDAYRETLLQFEKEYGITWKKL